MQTLTSIWWREWSGRTARLPLSIFFFFLTKPTGTCTSYLDQWGLKRTRRSAQESAFWGSDRYAPKFSGKNPQKQKWIGLSSRKDKNSNPYKLKTTQSPIMTKFLQGTRTTNEPSWMVPLLPTNPIWRTAAILNFGKMLITPDWI